MRVITIEDVVQSRRVRYGLRFSKYFMTGVPALELLDEDGKSLSVLTANMPNDPPPPGCIWLYAADKLELLVRNHILDPDPVKKAGERLQAYRLRTC